MIGRAARWLAALLLLAPSPIRAQSACPRATLPAYAHNDYANRRPLVDALALGYRGVEADVFLVGDTLRLGHDRRAARRGPVFEATYAAPLAALAARCGALTDDGTPFLLTVELKEPSPAAYDALVRVLARHRALAPAVEVVLVGWTPDAATLGTAPLPMARQHRLTRPAPPATGAIGPDVRLVSVDYGRTLGRRWTRAATRRRWLAALRATRAAHPDVRLRVHNVPTDAAVYRALADAGVHLVGTKQLAASAPLLAALRAPPPAAR